MIFLLAAAVAIGLVSLVALAIVVIDGAVAVWILLAPAGLGIVLLTRLVPQLDRARLLVFGSAIGYAILSMVVLICGLAGIMSRIFWIVFLVAGTLCSAVVIYRMFISGSGDQRSKPKPAAGRTRLALAVILPFLIITLLGTTIPPGVLWAGEGRGYDVLEYHLQGPREWFDAGKINYLPHNVYTSLPFNAEMSYLLAMIVYQSPHRAIYCCQLIHCFTVIMFVLTVYVICRQWSLSAGLAALVITASCPWLTYLGPLAYNEGGMLWLSAVVLGLVLYKRPGHTEDRPPQIGPAAAAGLAAGLACGFKYTAGAMIALPAAIVLLWRSAGTFSKWSTRRTLLPLACYLAACVLAVCPWLVRNYCWTGNPVYPFAYKYLDGKDWNDQLDQRWQAAHKARPEQQSLKAKMAALYRQGLTNPIFIRIEAAAANLLGRQDHAKKILSPPPIRQRPHYGLALVLLPAMLLVVRKLRATDRQMLFVLALQALFWLGFTHLQDRFLVLCIIPAAIIAAGGATLLTRRPMQVLYIGILALAAVVNFTEVYKLFYRHTHSPAGQPIAWYGQDQVFLDNQLNKHLPVDAKVMLVGEARAFYYNRPTVYWTVFNNNGFVNAAKAGPQQAGDFIYRNGITHIYIDWPEVRRLQRTYDFDPCITPALFARLQTPTAGITLQKIDLPKQMPHYELYRVIPRAKAKS